MKFSELFLAKEFYPEFVFRLAAWIVARVIYRVRVTGNENIPLEGPAVCVCNHVSFVDWLIIYASARRPVSFVMDHSYFKGGFLMKKLFMQAKVILICSQKDNPELYARAFQKMEEVLETGGIICVFPEGKITYDGEFSEFRPGILKLLKSVPVPVIPMALSGLWGSLFSRYDKTLLAKRPRKLWAKIYLDIGPAIAPSEVSIEKLLTAVQILRRFR